MSEASRVQTLLTEQNKELDRRSVALEACQEALSDVLGELREARDRIRALEDVLEMAMEYFDDRADVVDGEDGRPEANTEMEMVSAISQVLEGPVHR